MKLWLLRPLKDADDLEPAAWDPWYDKAFGFVVRADSEDAARGYAQEQAGSEAYDDDYERTRLVWLDPALVACTPLTDEGEGGVILRDFRSA